MSMEDAFLADIIEHPEDDTPRLVFADWLEDRGDAPGRDLAEFIRLQIELEEPRDEGPALWAMRWMSPASRPLSRKSRVASRAR